jgi:hypothetical protein
MASLKNADKNEQITKFVSLNEKQEVIRIIHKTLDGASHIQRIGEPSKSYELTLYVNEQGKQMLMQVEDTGALLEVTVQSGVYSGRITELKDFEKMIGGYYKVVLILSI